MSSSSIYSLFSVPPGRRGDMIDLNVARARKRFSARPALSHRVGSASALSRAAAAGSREPDPYVLVLLADQEIDRNRHDEAESLIEAAYAAYDQFSFGS